MRVAWLRTNNEYSKNNDTNGTKWRGSMGRKRSKVNAQAKRSHTLATNPTAHHYKTTHQQAQTQSKQIGAPGALQYTRSEKGLSYHSVAHIQQSAAAGRAGGAVRRTTIMRDQSSKP